jgi:hypothetical protein
MPLGDQLVEIGNHVRRGRDRRLIGNGARLRCCPSPITLTKRGSRRLLHNIRVHLDWGLLPTVLIEEIHKTAGNMAVVSRRWLGGGRSDAKRSQSNNNQMQLEPSA